MKKLLAILLASIMVLSLTGCVADSTEQSFYGTWEIESAEVDGSKFTLEELEALGM